MDRRDAQIDFEFQATARSAGNHATNLSNSQNAVIAEIEEWERDGNSLHLLHAIAILHDMTTLTAGLAEQISSVSMSVVHNLRGIPGGRSYDVSNLDRRLDPQTAMCAHAIGAQGFATGNYVAGAAISEASPESHHTVHILKAAIHDQGRAAAHLLQQTGEHLTKVAQAAKQSVPFAAATGPRVSQH